MKILRFPVPYTDNFYMNIFENKVEHLVMELTCKMKNGTFEKLIIGAIVYQNK